MYTRADRVRPRGVTRPSVEGPGCGLGPAGLQPLGSGQPATCGLPSGATYSAPTIRAVGDCRDEMLEIGDRALPAGPRSGRRVVRSFTPVAFPSRHAGSLRTQDIRDPLDGRVLRARPVAGPTHAQTTPKCCTGPSAYADLKRQETQDPGRARSRNTDRQRPGLRDRGTTLPRNRGPADLREELALKDELK